VTKQLLWINERLESNKKQFLSLEPDPILMVVSTGEKLSLYYFVVYFRTSIVKGYLQDCFTTNEEVSAREVISHSKRL